MAHATSAIPHRLLVPAGEPRLPSTEWSDLFAQIYAQRNPRIFRPKPDASFDSPGDAVPANPVSPLGSIMKNGRLRSELL
jgi:hypothetical protein